MYQETIDDARSGRLTADDMRKLGLSEGDTLYVNPGDFIQGGQMNVSAAEVATPEEQARMKVLADIYGQSGLSAEGIGTVQQVAGAEAVGKPAGNLYDFNKQGFMSQQEAAKAKYLADQAELAKTQQQLDVANTAYSALPSQWKTAAEARILEDMFNRSIAGSRQDPTQQAIIRANYDVAKRMQDARDAAEQTLKRRQEGFDREWSGVRRAVRR
jgi:hypothetical protein